MGRSILMRNSFAVCSHWQICVNYILYWVCCTSQCMNGIIWTKKLQNLIGKEYEVVHTRILLWKHLPLQDSCMVFLGLGMCMCVLLFLSNSNDFPAFYETSVCLSCMAYILLLSRNSCYSLTVHIALLYSTSLWTQVQAVHNTLLAHSNIQALKLLFWSHGNSGLLAFISLF